MHRTLQRLRAEFLEMPGLRLTALQIQRLCGIDETMCQAVLGALVEADFLRLNPDGTYARRTDEQYRASRAAKAHMRGAPRLRDAS